MRQKGDTNYVGLCAFRSRPMSVHVTAELGCRWHSSGGQEAHLVADELAKSSIAVILSPPRAFPESWDARRALPGPPLTHDSHTTVLHRAGVKLALGVRSVSLATTTENSS